jgi:hypothetical protein
MCGIDIRPAPLRRPDEAVALLAEVVLYLLDTDRSLYSAFGIAYRIPSNDEGDDYSCTRGECCPPLDDAVFS